MKNKNKVFWVWLSLLCGPSSRLGVNLISSFGDAESVYGASAKELLASDVIKEKDRAFSDILRHDKDDAEDVLKWCGKNGVDIITPDDKNYPSNLFALRDAPLVLYCVGTLPEFDRVCSIACVGSRHMSEYGKVTSFKFGYGLAKGGATVVSGLALGVDSMSMASAEAAGAPTVGVLGCGIDVVYPKEHASLFRTVMENGTVITEYAPGSKPQKSAFPQRNRIIAALSQGTLVVEAASNSGSLITARHAIYQGKDLFSVPGNIEWETSEGTNNLIKEGAYAVTDPIDILERYEYVYPHTIDTNSARHALADVDFSLSASRVANRYGVTSSQDRSNVYSRRADPVYFEDPVVKKGEVQIPDPFDFDIPENFGSKPEKIEAGTKRERPKGFRKAPKEPKRVDFELLSDVDLKVYNSMKPDTPMIPEELISDDLAISDVMASLTMLEISGAVEAGAGGYFMRCGADDAPITDVEE